MADTAEGTAQLGQDDPHTALGQAEREHTAGDAAADDEDSGGRHLLLLETQANWEGRAPVIQPTT
ncbi:hypothetical protein FHR83_005687 [Actinoplanes campanulatus]|uniref:Uncharacterized protein n=1 Tax=Actinoplanes campanulatus TaxID=113559 RepID=A0A7W5AKZ8_9ACTN|nr:hypothetical protein [Actinoplanes campanulatus]MBB3098002.1 hypothetical protein [Actinoplanes campanulatus]